jgi:hypothetical protein
MYLLDIVDRLVSKDPANRTGEWDRILIKELTVELDRLDPRDFAPTQQAEFVVVKAQLKTFCAMARGNPNMMLRMLRHVLGGYEGEGAHLKSRTFSYIADADLRTVIYRDYRELILGLIPSRSWKSSVVIAGSILEAILYALLTADKRIIADADAAASAYRKSGKPCSIVSGQWTLASLLRVAAELEVLPVERADTVDRVIREYRNFIHPQKEIRSRYSIGEAEALLAKGALESICNHFESTRTATTSS